MNKTLALLLVLLPACGTVRSSIFDGNDSVAAEQFEFLKKLEGTWVGQTTHEGKTSEIVSSWRVTAAGTAVEETLFAGTQHEMVTLFHRDGGSVMATHYCSAGNQPRLRAIPDSTGAAGMGESVQFQFFDSTNLRSTDEAHMGALRVTRMGDTLKERWTAFANGKIDHEAEFTLTRRK